MSIFTVIIVIFKNPHGGFKDNFERVSKRVIPGSRKEWPPVWKEVTHSRTAPSGKTVEPTPSQERQRPSRSLKCDNSYQPTKLSVKRASKAEPVNFYNQIRSQIAQWFDGGGGVWKRDSHRPSQSHAFLRDGCGTWTPLKQRDIKLEGSCVVSIGTSVNVVKMWSVYWQPALGFL